MTENNKDLNTIIRTLSIEERKSLYVLLGKEFNYHPLEDSLGLKADVVLQALSIMKEQGGLTWRMLRGVLVETAWGVSELLKYPKWKDMTPKGDLPYDYLVHNGNLSIRVQVKLQRSKDGIPMSAKQGYKYLPETMFCVETQKTRGGTDSEGANTRPYRFGEFDILAVSLQPSTGRWDDFIYTVSSWLLPDKTNTSYISKFQPVSKVKNEDWTHDFEEVVSWSEEKIIKKLKY